MLPSVEGVYRDGKIELREPAPKGANGRVIVTFLSSSAVDLNDHNITPAQAADLRGRLSAFAEDWNDPKMDSYDEV